MSLSVRKSEPGIQKQDVDSKTVYRYDFSPNAIDMSLFPYANLHASRGVNAKPEQPDVLRTKETCATMILGYGALSQKEIIEGLRLLRAAYDK